MFFNRLHIGLLLLSMSPLYTLRYEEPTQEIQSSQESNSSQENDDIFQPEADYKQLCNLFRCFKPIFSTRRYQNYKHRKLEIERQTRTGQNRINAIGRLLQSMYDRYELVCVRRNVPQAEEILGQIEAVNHIVIIL